MNKSNKAPIESYHLTSRYVVKLWRLKVVRADYFNAEMGNILEMINGSIVNRKARGLVTDELEGVRDDITFLMSFGAKIIIEVTLTDQYQCARPEALYRDFK